MPLAASTCLRGVCCITVVEKATPTSSESHDPNQRIPRTNNTSRHLSTGSCHGLKMSNSDPSEFELHRKARSLGLLLRQEGSIVSGLNFQMPSSKGPHTEENRDNFKFSRQTLPGIGGPQCGDGLGNYRNQQLPVPRAVALPKIPSIKHPFERHPPQIIQSEGTISDPPLSLTSLLMTPRSKTTLDSATFIGKKFKPSPTGNRWSTHPQAAPNTLESDWNPSNPSRLVISPKSKADLQRSPGDYYQRKFPHVHLDHDSKIQLRSERNRVGLLGNKTVHNQNGVSNTIRSTNELYALTRSKTDLMAVEQLISRSTDKINSTRSWAVSGWLHGMTCNPKKLHRRDLENFVK